MMVVWHEPFGVLASGVTPKGKTPVREAKRGLSLGRNSVHLSEKLPLDKFPLANQRFLYPLFGYQHPSRFALQWVLKLDIP